MFQLKAYYFLLFRPCFYMCEKYTFDNPCSNTALSLFQAPWSLKTLGESGISPSLVPTRSSRDSDMSAIWDL